VEIKQERRKTLSPEIVAIHARLDAGDKEMKWLKTNLAANTIATEGMQADVKATQESVKTTQADVKTIAQNTQGLVTLTTELEAGTRFLCRMALGVRFVLKEVIEPFWKPTLICFITWNLLFNHSLPVWASEFLKIVGG
jgi:hypothetical protein